MNQQELTFRTALPRDIPAMAELLGMLFEIEEDFEPDPAKQRRALELFLEAEHGVIFVAERENVLAGLCIVSLAISTAEGGWSGEIEDLVIHPDFRRQGLGEQFLALAEEWSCRQGAVRMRLNCDETNLPALAFYEKTGWQKSHLRIYFSHLKG